VDESRARSQRRRAAAARRRRRRRLGLLAGIALGGIAIAASVAVHSPQSQPKASVGVPSGMDLAAGTAPNDRRRAFPDAAAIARAWRFGSGQPGFVSAAAIDSGGRVTALRGRRLFVSASVVKAVMLAAFLRELERDGAELSSASAALLEEMITYSDNAAADAVYYRLGDERIEAAARVAGARTLDVRGYWAETYLSARDGARFIWMLPRLLAPAHRRFALRLLASIVSYQRWGVPAAAGDRWRVWFKGGWRRTNRGALTHQMALLRRGGRRVAIAILTDGMPSAAAGIETIEGIGRRLLSVRGGRSPADRVAAARPES
jgi:Beta-lactamase enzyme family